MNTRKDVLNDLKVHSVKEKKEIFPRFFKTGKGEYGEGDLFWGITVPNIRNIAKKYFKNISFEEVKKLVEDPIHEVRLTGYLILTYKFEKVDMFEKRKIVDFYLNNLSGVNNWDIVDLSCYKILGEYIFLNPGFKNILYELAYSGDLWKERISIVSTYALIRRGMFEDTLNISKRLLNHKPDLIHKAIGWMLREVGKRDLSVLRRFLNENIRDIPRTTLRYAIERMDENERERYLRL